jgi:uncharacterized RDD family membrane protein YckC
MADRRPLRARLVGSGIVLAGIVLAGLAAFADVLVPGMATPGFGYRQFLGTAVGFSLIVVGFAIALSGDASEP